MALPISGAKRELASLIDTRQRRLTTLNTVIDADSADHFIGDAFGYLSISPKTISSKPTIAEVYVSPTMRSGAALAPICLASPYLHYHASN